MDISENVAKATEFLPRKMLIFPTIYNVAYNSWAPWLRIDAIDLKPGEWTVLLPFTFASPVSSTEPGTQQVLSKAFERTYE